MSSTIAQPSVTKSMNGVVTYNDGQGTEISNGVVTAQTLNVVNLNTQNIVAPDPSLDSSLYVDDITDVYLASSCFNLYIRTLTLTTAYLTTYGFTEFLQANDPSRAIALYTNVDNNTIFLGSNTSPIVSPYTCVNSDELANKGYVDSVISTGGASLTATQTFSGVNTFDNTLYVGTTSSTIAVFNSKCVFSSPIIGDITYDSDIASNINFYFKIGGVNTSLMQFSGGTTAYNGVMSFLTGTYSLSTQSLISLISPIIRLENIALNTFLDIDTQTAGTIASNYKTNTASSTTITSSIVASGGTTTNTGDITINGGSLNLNAPITNDVTFSSGTNTAINWFFKILGVATSKIQFSGGTTTYNGVMSFLTGTFSIAASVLINIASPLFKFENTASTTAMDVDLSVAGTAGLEFRTNTSIPANVTSSIVASGGTTANTGTITATQGTLKLTSGTTTEITSPSVKLMTGTSLYGDVDGSGLTLPLFVGNCTTLVTAATTLTMSNTARETMIIIPTGTTTSFTITLSTSNVRDSATFHIFNFGTGTITISGGSTRMFGTGYTLGGGSSIPLGSGVGRSFRCCAKSTGIGNASNNAAGWYVHT